MYLLDIPHILSFYLLGQTTGILEMDSFPKMSGVNVLFPGRRYMMLEFG
jgi:hypothetical protein